MNDRHDWHRGNGNSNLTPMQVMQVDVIVALQHSIGLNKSAFAPRVMRLVSLLGTGRFIFPACIFTTWLWDVEVGTALQELLVLILVIMSVSKTIFKQPR